MSDSPAVCRAFLRAGAKIRQFIIGVTILSQGTENPDAIKAK